MNSEDLLLWEQREWLKETLLEVLLKHMIQVVMIILNEDFGAAFGKEIKGHYGADYLMLKDINDYLN